VRASNIGRSLPNDNALEVTKRKANNQVLVHDYHEQIKLRLPSELLAKKMIEVDSELKDALENAYVERAQLRKAMEGKPSEQKPISEEVRLLHRAYRHMREDNIDVPEEWQLADCEDDEFAYKRSRAERKKDMETIEVYRERHKRSLIQSALKKQLTTVHKIDASFGQGYFFEFVFRNPYNEDHNFEIFWEDTELRSPPLTRIITSDHEWLYHRRRNNVFDKIESNLVTPIVEGRAQVFMNANEEIHVPFVFQSFTTEIEFGDILRSETRKVNPQQAKTVHVSFLNSKRAPVAFLDVIVNAMNFFIDKSIQMFHYENELVRKCIRYQIQGTHPSNSDAISSIHIENSSGDKFLKCSHPDVVCSLNHSRDSKYREISFKYRVSGAPDHTNIYFVFYNDQYCSSVFKIWRVCIHTLFRLDVNAIFGQTNHSSLVLRGGTMSRQVWCFTNLPCSVVATRPGPFTLPANSLTEVPLSLKFSDSESQVIANVVGNYDLM
jgi:nephrocystin-4